MGSDKKNLPADKHLFQQAMGGVVPLKSAATTDSRAPKTKNAKRKQRSRQAIFSSIDTLLCADALYQSIPAGTSHRKNGVQLKVMQKLKRGRYVIGDCLDMHHMNTATGKLALLEFLHQAQHRAIVSVRIIHGKGLHSKDGPKLKIMTRQILTSHSQVLAYTACKPGDGGDGATDVLLK